MGQFDGSELGLGWVGLGLAGFGEGEVEVEFGWLGLSWAGFGEVEFGWFGLAWVEFGWLGLARLAWLGRLKPG